jgi:hypothetical protein
MIRAFVCWRELSRIVLIRDAEKGTFDRAAEIAVSRHGFGSGHAWLQGKRWRRLENSRG